MSTANVYLDFIGATPQNQKCWRIFSSKMKREKNTFSDEELNRDQVNSMVEWTIFENEKKKIVCTLLLLEFCIAFLLCALIVVEIENKSGFSNRNSSP